MKLQLLTASAVLALALPCAMSAQQPQTPPDEQFVRGMIMHHGQAIEMAAMVPARSTSRALRTLAARIDLSQRDEIARMKTWLGPRADSTTSHDHMAHSGATALMPGMLTAAQLDSLRSLRGRAFERRFLGYMIAHHQGALIMVTRLLGTQGAIRDPMLFQLANSIDADQRAEIARMRAMLSTPSSREK